MRRRHRAPTALPAMAMTLLAAMAALAACVAPPPAPPAPTTTTTTTTAPPGPGASVLVARSSTWRFRTGSSVTPGWATPAFDDASWDSGPAELGYGDGDEATVLDGAGTPGSYHLTTWYRTRFFVPDASKVGHLAAELVRDDGAALYLNGSEVGRSNLPAGPLGPDTPSVTATSDESSPHHLEIDRSGLRSGWNQLAVEVHQHSRTSSDSSFSLELTAWTAPREDVVRLLVAGDTGSADAAEDRVAAALRSRARTDGADAVVLAGDNVYPDGHPSRFAAALDGPYGEVAADRPLLAALGNHDVASGHGAEQLAHLGLAAPYYEQDLSHGGVDVQVLVLDSNADLAAQATWASRRLAEGEFEYRLVVFHHPPFSCSTHGPDRATASQFVPVLEAGGADLVISGHEHNYQHFSHGGADYVVTGGGGAAIYPVGPCPSGSPTLLAAHARHHFLDVEATASQLVVRARATDGTVLDSFSRRR